MDEKNLAIAKKWLIEHNFLVEFYDERLKGAAYGLTPAGEEFYTMWILSTGNQSVITLNPEQTERVCEEYTVPDMLRFIEHLKLGVQVRDPESGYVQFRATPLGIQVISGLTWFIDVKAQRRYRSKMKMQNLMTKTIKGIIKVVEVGQKFGGSMAQPPAKGRKSSGSDWKKKAAKLQKDVDKMKKDLAAGKKKKKKSNDDSYQPFGKGATDYGFPKYDMDSFKWGT